MFGWRRRSEGFEWREHVKTAVLVRRADRQRRLDDARLAALSKVKDVKDRGVEAGKAHVAEAQNWLWVLLETCAGAAVTALKFGYRAAASGFAKSWTAVQSVLQSAVGRIPTAALPGAALGKLSIQRVKQAIPALTLHSFLRPQLFFYAGFLLLIVLAGGRALAPAPAVRDAQITTASITSTELAADGLTGRATALAGDVLRISGTVVRLKGIEAPENQQSCLKSNGRRWSCGTAALDGLSRLVRAKTVTCETSGTDEQGRPLATCATTSFDVASEMVRRGYAFAATGFFHSFGSEEELAKTQKVGLWQGEAERPSQWRQRRWEEAKKSSPDGCPIKGYVRSSGRMYAMPWSQDYANGKVRTVKGERWFCSEDDARAAGFKLSSRS